VWVCVYYNKYMLTVGHENPEKGMATLISKTF
jgi:hypothetical protein